MSTALYNLNKDLAQVEYLQILLKDLKVQFNLSFDHMLENNLNTWFEFKHSLLNFQHHWNNSEVKRVPYINYFKNLALDQMEIKNKMHLRLQYFDAVVEFSSGSVKFESPSLYTNGLNSYLEKLENEFGNEFVNVKSKESVVPVSKVFILFIIGIIELDKYTSSIHFEWLFNEFKCTVPVNYLYKRSLHSLETVVQEL
eukprot:NODE_345_length_10548_cov_0.306728.p6 type:complete len:198 gc:universal NODE_345_length_10548_cov_0.306728:1742-2335(+)